MNINFSPPTGSARVPKHFQRYRQRGANQEASRHVGTSHVASTQGRRVARNALQGRVHHSCRTLGHAEKVLQVHSHQKL